MDDHEVCRQRILSLEAERDQAIEALGEADLDLADKNEAIAALYAENRVLKGQLSQLMIDRTVEAA